jgi:quinolinate synthase
MSLPTRYLDYPDEVVIEKIRQAKRELGSSVTILGHYYQRDEVIQFADFQGDSLELSRQAARATLAKYIVFCGVTFMSETAAILCQPGTIVIQPAETALCPMAQMANVEDVDAAWRTLDSIWPGDITPITYQNSTADIKAFVGRRDGAVCTSSNAGKLFKWAFAKHHHILFMPDEHLGTNTALALGLADKEIGLWDPIVENARQQHPGCLVVVHPECPHEVVARADVVGSTSGIIQAVAHAPAGAVVYIGTEWHLVNRLAQQYPDKLVLPLRRSVCSTMAMTTMRHLLYALESIVAGQPVGVINVDEDTARWARVALERMLEAS